MTLDEAIQRLKKMRTRALRLANMHECGDENGTHTLDLEALQECIDELTGERDDDADMRALAERRSTSNMQIEEHLNAIKLATQAVHDADLLYRQSIQKAHLASPERFAQAQAAARVVDPTVTIDPVGWICQKGRWDYLIRMRSASLDAVQARHSQEPEKLLSKEDFQLFLATWGAARDTEVFSFDCITTRDWSGIYTIFETPE